MSMHRDDWIAFGKKYAWQIACAVLALVVIGMIAAK